jgi:hypothetical protein
VRGFPLAILLGLLGWVVVVLLVLWVARLAMG